MLKIYTGEDVIVGNDPLYRTILEEARRLKIAGATVIKGIEGYATEVRGIDRRPVSLFTGVSNLPVLVTIVDQKENLEKLIPFLEKKALFFSLVYFMRFPGFGAVALVVQTCLRGFPAFFLSLPPIKQYQENYEIFRHECMLRLKN